MAIEHPGTDAELRAIVRQAADRGSRLKVVGAGAAGALSATDGVRIHLGAYRRVLAIDRDRGLATVQAGITLGRLNRTLAARGLSLEHPAGTADQTIGGAVSTGQRANGGRSVGLASQVHAIGLIAADASVLACSARSEPEIFDAVRVGLGAVAVITTVTLRCVAGFNLRTVTRLRRLEQVLSRFERDVDDHDHFEFTWLAGSGWAITTSSDRTDDAVGGHRLDHVDRGYRTLCRPRRVGGGVEMAYSIPRPATVEVLQRVREVVGSSRRGLFFPIRVAVAAADDIALSTANGWPSTSIALRALRSPAGRSGLGRIEAVMAAVGGRPRWAGFHTQTSDTLRPRYPQWDSWQAVRRVLDPDARFANAYTEAVLGA